MSQLSQFLTDFHHLCINLKSRKNYSQKTTQNEFVIHVKSSFLKNKKTFIRFITSNQGYKMPHSKRRNNFPKKRTKVYGSSHGNHGFQEKFSSYMEQDTKHYYTPLFDCQGGREIDHEFVLEIISDMQNYSEQGEPFIAIIICGTNNIRKKGVALDIMEVFLELADAVSNLPRVHLVINGMLPSPQTDEDTRKRVGSKWNFSEASSMLKTMCDSSDKITFIDLGSIFTRGGFPKAELFNKGGIHLNSKGVDILAKANYDKVRTIPHSFLSK